MPLTFTPVFPESIGSRYNLGPLGFGWTDEWQISLQQSGNGTVAITLPDGSQLAFNADTRGGYFSGAGDYGTLTDTGGVFLYTDASGNVYTFLPGGLLGTVADAYWNKITAGYNGSNQLTTLTADNGDTLMLAYNAQGRISTVTDPSKQATNFTYDAAGQQLLSIAGPDGTTQYQYVTGQGAAREHALAEVTNPDGTQIFYSYDSMGRRIGTHLENNLQPLTFAYPGESTIQITDATPVTTTVWLNDLGLVARVQDPLGDSTELGYDANGNLVQITDPNGAVYRDTYDARANLTSTTDPLGETTYFTYNTNNDLTSYTDANGNMTSYAYDSHDDLLSIRYANGTQQQFTYNPLGEATGFLNARGNAIGYIYDAQGNLTHENFADGTSYVYTYDNRGNLTTAKDSQGNVTTFVYGGDANNPNNPDLLTEVKYPDGTFLKFSYYPGGLRKQSVDQTGYTVNYTYDGADDLSELTDGSGNLIVKYSYDNAGNLIQKDNGNGTRTVYTYDLNGDARSITNYAPDHTTVNSFDIYTYDSLGNTLTDTNQDGQWAYAYDADSELIQAVFTPNSTDPDGLAVQSIKYAYDAAGNRSSQNVNGVVTNYVVNNVNEVTSSITAGLGTTAYQYDLDGNLSAATDPTGNTTNYTYDDLNQLTAVKGPGLSASYFHDPLGNLVSQTVNGATTNFQVDPTGYGDIAAGTVVAAFSGGGVYSNSGGLLEHYTYGLGLVNQVSAAGSAAYYDFGLAGNTIGITDAAGTYVDQYSYLPFGQTVTIKATLANPFTFVGQFGAMNDGSGLLLMGARSYDPDLGRFAAPDPLGLGGGFANLQIYVENNPVSEIDPTGQGGIVDLPVTSNNPDVRERAFEQKQEAQRRQQAFNAGATTSVTSTAPTTSTTTPTSDDPSTDDPDPRPHYSPPNWHFLRTPGWLQYHQYNNEYEKKLDEWKKRHTSTHVSIDVLPPIGTVASAAVIGAVDMNELDNFIASIFSGAKGILIAIISSFDPNDEIGPTGFGSSGFIAATPKPLPYRIDFENDPTATAPAQTVTITDQLSANYDWSTFQFTEVGFGDNLITVPTGNGPFFQTTVPMTYNGETFNVQIQLSIDLATGLVSATFQSIDPNTDLPPDALAGFLPPEDGTGRGMGHVSYIVEQKPNLATGTALRNVASVTFDQNAAITTNQVDDSDASKGTDPTKEDLLTIDAGAPTSSVTALPAFSQGKFTVSWNGQDDAGGSGVAGYDLYVSDNGGTATLYQSGLTATSLQFTGQNGHTYAFYTLATDNVGNVQTAAAAAQKTTVDTTLPATTEKQTGTTGSGGWYTSAVTVTLSASDTGSGVAKTLYSLDGGTTWQTYASPFSVSTQGSTTVQFYSVDKAGNTEATSSDTFKIDSIAPSTTNTLTGTAGSNGWYVSASVGVTLAATDAGSGVAGTFYTIDGGSQQTYAGAFTVSGDAIHTLKYYSVDKAGNTEATHTQTIEIDTTPPVLMLPADQTFDATQLGGGLANYVGATATDNLTTPTITYSQDAGTVFALGTTAVQVTATDAAGNQSHGSFNVTVVAAPANHVSIDNIYAGQVIAAGKFPVTVNADDPFGNVDLTYTGSLTLGISSGPRGGKLIGVTMGSIASGVGTLDNLLLRIRLGSYTLDASKWWP